MSSLFVTLTLAEIRRTAMPLTLSASAQDRADIAARFGLVALDRLDATITLTPDAGDTVIATGEFVADVVQSCIATGEPLPAHIESPLSLRFVPLTELGGEEGEVELSGDDLDVIHYAEGRIAVGDMVAETMALALDPWPRSPDADAFLAAKGVKGEAESGAFGALAGLRDRLSKGS